MQMQAYSHILIPILYVVIMKQYKTMITTIVHNISYNWMILHFIYNDLYRLINIHITNIKYASNLWSIWPWVNCVHGVLNRSFVVSIMYYITLHIYSCYCFTYICTCIY